MASPRGFRNRATLARRERAPRNRLAMKHLARPTAGRRRVRRTRPRRPTVDNASRRIEASNKRVPLRPDRSVARGMATAIRSARSAPGRAPTLQRLRESLDADPFDVLFRELSFGDPSGGPVGALGIASTAGVSVAADPQSVPSSAPLVTRSDRPGSARLGRPPAARRAGLAAGAERRTARGVAAPTSACGDTSREDCHLSGESGA